ncbi:MAG: ABC transporter permease [Planctomycetes bacterium]|nr:ABC transporter permease [Planctomycetota bacterium]
MNRVLGVLAVVAVIYFGLMSSDPQARSPENHQNLERRIGEWGILTLGVGFVILTGGIDLSIGSVVCLSAVGFGLILENNGSPPLAFMVILASGALIGLVHGLLITRLNLQPFIVTLCGLFIYRGLAQLLTQVRFDVLAGGLGRGWPEGSRILRDSSRNIGLSQPENLAWLTAIQKGNLPLGEWTGIVWLDIPNPLVLFAMLAIAAFLLLECGAFGRRVYALGFNEQAARYAGINTSAHKVACYVICSTLAALGGILFLVKVPSAAPASAGNWFELYAITGAVLGGFSLRGGEGSVLGLALGTAILPLLRSLVIFAGIPSDLEFMVIGFALLLGTVADELLRRGSFGKVRGTG